MVFGMHTMLQIYLPLTSDNTISFGARMHTLHPI